MSEIKSTSPIASEIPHAEPEVVALNTSSEPLASESGVAASELATEATTTANATTEDAATTEAAVATDAAAEGAAATETAADAPAAADAESDAAPVKKQSFVKKITASIKKLLKSVSK